MWLSSQEKNGLDFSRKLGMVEQSIHPAPKKRLNFSQASGGTLKFDANPENGLHRQQSHPDMMWNIWD